MLRFLGLFFINGDMSETLVNGANAIEHDESGTSYVSREEIGPVSEHGRKIRELHSNPLVFDVSFRGVEIADGLEHIKVENYRYFYKIRVEVAEA